MGKEKEEEEQEKEEEEKGEYKIVKDEIKLSLFEYNAYIKNLNEIH